MKPRLFIGSSVENLQTSYAIQQGLEYDANVTIWNQGVFRLSESSLDSLINELDKTDFAVFVFQPDDITIIRDKKVNTIRDNLVFELGLFIGKLGKDRVYFLLPRQTDQLHLPTDLLGITPGYFDASRDDGNVNAAVGPFCNQVRTRMRDFMIENLSDIQNESLAARKIVYEKQPGWEYDLTQQLLNDKIQEIRIGYSELKNGLVVQRSKRMSGKEFFDWYSVSLTDFTKLSEVFVKAFEELNESYGEPGQNGSALGIKTAIDRLLQISKEALAWEYELETIEPPDELIQAKNLLSGWSRMILDKMEELISRVDNLIDILNDKSNNQTEIRIVLELEVPENIKRVTNVFRDYDFSLDY